jgi:hypothetical protein
MKDYNCNHVTHTHIYSFLDPDVNVDVQPTLVHKYN